jgi:hypothetical protein
LLSVVAQAFAFALVVFIYFYAGENLPPSSGDADEGWVPYWVKSVCLSWELNASTKSLIIL